METNQGRFNRVPPVLMAIMGAFVWATVASPAVLAGSPDQMEHRLGVPVDSMVKIISRHPPGDDQGHYEFVLSESEIPAGWTTFKHVNASSSTHFVYMIRLPDDQADMTRDEYMAGVPMDFQTAWDPYFAGDINVQEFFGILGPSMPEWFGRTVASGGPGLLGGHRTGWTTMNLAPGTYILECYVMDGDGIFHNVHGMLERLVVTEVESGVQEPEADLQVSVSTTDGLVFEHEHVQPGTYNVRVTFEDNVAYGHGLGHDVHLIRLDDGTTVQQVNDWINYLDVGPDGFYADRGALISASGVRGPQSFLGGVQSVFADKERGRSYPQTAYMHVNLTPGRYAWVSEVPNPMQPDPERPEFSLLHAFSVNPGASLTGSWFEPDTDGQGWNLFATPKGLSAMFFGYRTDGQPLWLIADQVAADIQKGEPVTFDLLHGHAGAFSNPVPPEQLEHWGQVTFVFDSCEEATAELSGIDGTEIQQLERVAETAGLPTCGL